MPRAEHIVWIDCEMTGLDKSRDALVEIACLVTDAELNILGKGVDVLIKPPAAALANMGDYVRDMHTSSGLLAELQALPDDATIEAAQAKVLRYIKRYVPGAGKAPLGGNTIATDKGFLERDMPALIDHLHYRMIDVSTLKELSRRWYPRVFFSAPDKTGNHRALGDIIDSINELRYYREAIMVSSPGPDTVTAREIAARIAPAPASPAEPDGPLP